MSAVDHPRIVVICGSTRFRAEIAAANRELTRAGAIVLAPGVFGHDGDVIEPGDKARLDALHRAKIRMADEVVIVCPRGYYGDSTRREIAYACELGKPLRFLTDAVPEPAAAPSLSGRLAAALERLTGLPLTRRTSDRIAAAHFISVITRLRSSISVGTTEKTVHGEDER